MGEPTTDGMIAENAPSGRLTGPRKRPPPFPKEGDANSWLVPSGRVYAGPQL
jgi:hypothetical protein